MLDEHLSTVKCLVILRHQGFTQHQEGEQNCALSKKTTKTTQPSAVEIKMPAFSLLNVLFVWHLKQKHSNFFFNL